MKLSHWRTRVRAPEDVPAVPVAAARDNSAESSTRPSILLTSTTRWPLGARVAISLSRVGCKVSALCLCSVDQPLLLTDAVCQSFSYSGLRPLQSLSEAIEVSCPQLLVPCDDRAAEHLHELHNTAPGSAIAALIERSLGPPDSYPIVSVRNSLLEVAREEGVRVADTSIINSPEELSAWFDREPFPWVLKADNTFAGLGVRVVSNLVHAQQCLSELRKLFKVKNTFRHLIIDGDPFWLRPWLRRCQPTVIIQRFIHGAPASCAVVCWEGRILAGTSVKVLRTYGPNKPATIVKVVNNSDMMLAAERIAGRLRLSGFFGLDFILDNRTGAPYLIEMNPRCSPPCHLALGHGRDLAAALSAQLSGQAARLYPAVTNSDIIAYFPGTWYSEIELKESCFHDIPQGEPLLVEELLRGPRRRTLLQSARRYLHSKTKSTKRFVAPTGGTSDVDAVSSVSSVSVGAEAAMNDVRPCTVRETSPERAAPRSASPPE